MKHHLVWELLILGTLVVFMGGCSLVETQQVEPGQFQQEVVKPSSESQAVRETVAQKSDGKTTYVGSTVVPVKKRSGSSGSSKDDEDVSVDLDVPDKAVEKDSGLNNNLVDLFAFTSDPRAVLNKLTFTLSSQSNTNVVNCGIDFNRYVDCTPQAGQAGYSQVEVTVSDGSESYTDLFVVTVLGEGEVQLLAE